MTIQRTSLPEVLNASAIRGADLSGYQRMAETFSRGGQIFSNLADLSYERSMKKYEIQGARDGRSAVTINPVTSLPEVSDVNMVDPETIYGQKFFTSLERTAGLAVENSISIKSSELQKKYPLNPETALEEMQAYTRGAVDNMPEVIRPGLEQTSAIVTSRMMGDINRNVIENSQTQAMNTNFDVLNGALAQMTNLNAEDKHGGDEYLNFQRQADEAFENLKTNTQVDLTKLNGARNEFDKEIFISQFQGKINKEFGNGTVKEILNAYKKADEFLDLDTGDMFTFEQKQLKHAEYKNRLARRLNDIKTENSAVKAADEQRYLDNINKTKVRFGDDRDGFREFVAKHPEAFGKASTENAKSLISANKTFMETADTMQVSLADKQKFILQSTQQMAAIEVAHPDLYSEMDGYRATMADFMLSTKQDTNFVQVAEIMAETGSIPIDLEFPTYVELFGKEKGLELFKKNQKNLNTVTQSEVEAYKGKKFANSGQKWDLATAEYDEKGLGPITNIGTQMEEVIIRTNKYGRLAPSAGKVIANNFEDPNNLDYDVVADIGQMRSLLMQGKYNPETGEVDNKNNKTRVDGWIKKYIPTQSEGIYDYLTRRIAFPKDQGELNDVITQYNNKHAKENASTSSGRLNLEQKQLLISSELEKVSRDLDAGVGAIGKARGVSQLASGFAFRNPMKKVYSDELLALWQQAKEQNPITTMMQPKFQPFGDPYQQKRTQWHPQSKDRIMQEITDRISNYARKTDDAVSEATEDVLQELIDTGRIGPRKVGNRNLMMLDPPELYANKGEIYRGPDGKLSVMPDSIPEGEITYEDMQLYFAGVINPDATDAELVSKANSIIITTESDMLVADANGEFAGATYRVDTMRFDGKIENALTSARFNAQDIYRNEAWRNAKLADRSNPNIFANVINPQGFMSNSLWMEWMKPSRMAQYLVDEKTTRDFMYNSLNKTNRKLILSGRNPIIMNDEDLDFFIKRGTGVSKMFGVFMFNRTLNYELLKEQTSDPLLGLSNVGKAIIGLPTPVEELKRREKLFRDTKK